MFGFHSGSQCIMDIRQWQMDHTINVAHSEHLLFLSDTSRTRSIGLVVMELYEDLCLMVSRDQFLYSVWCLLSLTSPESLIVCLHCSAVYTRYSLRNRGRALMEHA